MTNRIFGIIGWLGTAFVLAAIAIWVATRTSLNLSAQWDQYRFYLAWAGLVCILDLHGQPVAGDGRLFRRRQARYGTLAATSVLIVLAILVAVNYIGKQQNKRWDLTENKQFSLSDQSRNVVAKLDAPVEIMGFMPPADQPTTVNTFRDLLQEYANLSNQIKLDLVDVDRNPSVAAQNEVRAYGEIVIRHKGRTERVTSSQEQDVTNALIKVVSGQARTVYFTQGHGEKDPTSNEVTGYTGGGRNRSSARTTPSRSSCWRSRAACPTTRRSSSWRAARRFPARRGRHPRKVPREGRQAAARARFAGPR